MIGLRGASYDISPGIVCEYVWLFFWRRSLDVGIRSHYSKLDKPKTPTTPDGLLQQTQETLAWDYISGVCR